MRYQSLVALALSAASAKAQTEEKVTGVRSIQTVHPTNYELFAWDSPTDSINPRNSVMPWP